MFVSYAPTQVSAYGAKRNPGLEISMRPALKEHQRIASAYDVTDEQRSRRPIFNATLWAAAGWLFFRPAAAGLAPHVPHQFRARGMDADEEECKLMRDDRRYRL